MANIFQNVITYQMSSLALLTNQNCFISTSNTKFKDFDRMTANLGDTVTFDLPPRMTTVASLVASFQDTEQRVQTLTVDNPASSSYAFTSQEFIFNADEYMDRYGKSAVAEIGAKVESDVASLCVTNTFRFFGDGVTPINSYTQLAQALANYRAFGSPNHDVRGYLPLNSIPEIIGSGLTQFALDRNNRIADSWELGNFSAADWYQSNLLPEHIAGNVGQNATTLTFVSINAAGDQITFSGAGAGDPDAIKENDLLEFQSDIRFRTFIGHLPSSQKVQFRATADAAGDGGGIVVIDIFPALIDTAADRNQNITRPLVVADTATALPSHRAGAIIGGNALYLAMPQLPEEHPYASVSEHDPDTGVAMRLTYGSTFGQNQMGFINSVIWGKTLVDEYAMRMVFPL